MKKLSPEGTARKIKLDFPLIITMNFPLVMRKAQKRLPVLSPTSSEGFVVSLNPSITFIRAVESTYKTKRRHL